MTFTHTGLDNTPRRSRPQYRVLARFRNGNLADPLFKSQPTESIDHARKHRDELRASALHFWDDAQLALVTSPKTHKILERIEDP
jgi:hypothetical protein